VNVLVEFAERRLKRALEIAARTDLTWQQSRLARCAVLSHYRTLCALGEEKKARFLVGTALLRAEIEGAA
jgi:hypothetical protein